MGLPLPSVTSQQPPFHSIAYDESKCNDEGSDDPNVRISPIGGVCIHMPRSNRGTG